MATKKISNTDLDSNDLTNKLSDIFSFESTKRENVTSFEEVPLESIKLDPKGEFTSLFPLEEENICNISNNMKKKGFKKSQALTLITIENENIEFLGDGHNRREAALRAGIDMVPVYRESYPTRKEAKIAMLELQINRRQLTDSLKFKTVALLMELRGEKKEANSSGKKSEIIAAKTGMSSRQVEKINSIAKSDDQKLIDDVKNGKKSVSKAYQELHPQKKKTEYTNDNTSHLDSLSDTSGTPKPLSFNHSDGIERPNGKLSAEQDIIRTQQRKAAYEEGYTDGFLQCANYLLEEFLKNVDIKYLCFQIFEKEKPSYNYFKLLVPLTNTKLNDLKKSIAATKTHSVEEHSETEDDIIKQNMTFNFDETE